jgi:hypothetical protein
MKTALRHRLALAGLLVGLSLATPPQVLAGVGEPYGAGPGGTFSIRITQGATIIAEDLAAPFPVNIKIAPLDPVQIGTTPGGSPIVLTILSDFGPIEDFRITHWFINTPVSMADLATPSTNSLIDPGSLDPIRVEIGNIAFTGTPAAFPLVVNNNSFYTSYLLDANGRFFQTPNTNPYDLYGNGKVDVQVPGMWYVDGSPSPYQFTGTSGPVVSWVWDNLLPPGMLTQVVQNNGSLGGTGYYSPGHVWEMGLGVAFVVPEPSAAILLAAGGLLPIVARQQRKGLRT